MHPAKHVICAQAVLFLVVILQISLCFADQSLLSTHGNAATGAVSETQQLLDVLAQQGRTQQQTAAVLAALQQGTIKAHSALSLLQDITRLRESFDNGAAADRLKALRGVTDSTQQQQQQQRKPSQGILIVAGGRDQFKNAYILLKLLAHPDIACKLPVEVVHYGANEYDAPTAATIIYQLADETGISVRFLDGQSVDPTGYIGLDPHKPPGRLTGFKAKVHALVWVTSFDQVIMLDSDNTPLTDPTPLFDSPAFKAHGSMFWPDFWTNQWMQSALYSLLGLDVPWESTPEFRACEAGQVVLDRLRHHDVLEYLWLLNTHSNSGIPGAELGAVGQCLWGDKDTYPIAFQLAGKGPDFHMVQHKPLQALSRPGGAPSKRLAHAGMVHRAPWGSGPLMWLHRTAAGKFWPHCMARGGNSCKIWALTTPVDQQQLLATVRDPSAMELGVEQVDLGWWGKHCADYSSDIDSNSNDSSSSSSSSGDTSGDSSIEGSVMQASDQADSARVGQCSAEDGELGSCDLNGFEVVGFSNATALPCDLDKAVGVLPIPVIRTKKLPAHVKRLLQAAQEIFHKSQRISTTYQG